MNINREFLPNSSSAIKVRAGPSGLLLFNRDTGVNVLLDEFTLPSRVWSSAPRQVSIALTNACDLACPHCYAPKNRAVLDFFQLTRWIRELSLAGCLGVGFGGGEPTIYPHFLELCEYATNKTSLAVTMTTHAHRLNTQLLDDLAGNLHFVRISMDGVGETYESIRGRSFSTLIDRIESLKAIVPFGINFVVNRKTLSDLDDAIELAEKLGAAEFLLLPEQSVRGSGGIDINTLNALKKWVTNYRGDVCLSISESNADGFPTCNPLEDETGLHAFAHIDAEGVLKRTSFDAEGVQISENGVMDALNQLGSEFKDGAT